MTTLYATLADARIDNKATSTADDLYLFRAIRTVSQRVDRLMNNRDRPFFAPFIESRNVPVTGANVDTYNGLLFFPGNLLALTSVTNNGSTLTLGTDVAAYSYSGSTPYTALQLSAAYCGSWYDNCQSYSTRPLTTITGAWGYHGNYPYAWQQVDTLAAAIVDTASTTFTAHTVDAAGSDGNTPTFSPGHLIQIDSEWMNVTAVNNVTKVVTVQARGDNGSTAATHLINAPIKVYQVEPDIRHVVSRQAAMMNARKGAFTTVEVTALGTEMRYPADLEAQLRGALQGYIYA